MNTPSSPIANFAYRLKRLRDHSLATRLLWLAAEGRLELLADGAVGFWSDAPDLLERQEETESLIQLQSPTHIDPTWVGPAAGAAIWGAVDPVAIEAVEFDTRGAPVLEVRSFTLKLRVEAEEEVEILPVRTRPRRKGPARLYPRLARR